MEGKREWKVESNNAIACKTNIRVWMASARLPTDTALKICILITSMATRIYMPPCTQITRKNQKPYSPFQKIQEREKGPTEFYHPPPPNCSPRATTKTSLRNTFHSGIVAPTSLNNAKWKEKNLYHIYFIYVMQSCLISSHLPSKTRSSEMNQKEKQECQSHHITSSLFPLLVLLDRRKV